MSKLCKFCGSRFEPNHPARKFCSAKCSSKATILRRTRQYHVVTHPLMKELKKYGITRKQIHARADEAFLEDLLLVFRITMGKR